ncbi:MAG: hypothetical protein ACAI25_16785 [Planctomycetota bacterium]
MDTEPRRRVTRVDLVIVGVVVLVGAAAFRVGTMRLQAKAAHGETCSNRLRQLGMAAVQYSDDKRFLPHLGPISKLDPGYKSNVTSRVFRALVYFNYLDDPKQFVCPASPDAPAPWDEAVKKDPRTFRWSGEAGAPGLSPVVQGGAEVSDRPLDGATEISYGWTRRGLTTNTSALNAVAADKSMRVGEDASAASKAAHQGSMVGNHKDFMVVLFTDGHTRQITKAGDTMTMTTATISRAEASGSAGYLGVLGDDPEQGQ